jgi:hypothetical protein
MAETTASDATVDRERKLKRLRAELAIGEEQERRGELIDMTRQRFMQITDRAIDEAGNGAPIKDVGKPQNGPLVEGE